MGEASNHPNRGTGEEEQQLKMKSLAFSVLCIAILTANAKTESKQGKDVEDELEKLLMKELVPQLHELASRSVDNLDEAEDLFDRVDESALELQPKDRVFKRIGRGIRSIRRFVGEVKQTIRTVRDVIKNARYYFRMFKAARNYMKTYRRRNPVPRSMLRDLGIDEKAIVMDNDNNRDIDEDVEDDAE